MKYLSKLDFYIKQELLNQYYKRYGTRPEECSNQFLLDQIEKFDRGALITKLVKEYGV